MRYMLDTDICIYAINERPPKVVQALREHYAEGLGVSAITASELFYGIARTGAYFSDRGRLSQSDRGRCFSVIVDGVSF